MSKKKIFIIAGEASGDNIGASIISQWPREDVELYGVGGPKMQNAGLKDSLFPMSKLSLMGLVEIVPHLFELINLLNSTAEYVLELKPDVVITIDAPGFNNRLAKLIKKLNPDQKIVHVVAPSVWAINPSRAQKVAKYYDMLLTLLPFEPPYFTKHGLESHFIGHPILHNDFTSNRHEFCLRYGINESHLLLSVTAGSRVGEIKTHLPIFIETIEKLQLSIPQRLEILFCLSNPDHKKYFEDAVKNLGNIRVHFITEDVRGAYGAADLALAKSGTNTLEIAASGTPQVIAYRMHLITFSIMRILIKIKYACLVNIMADISIIPEYLQQDCNSDNLSRNLHEFALEPDIGKMQVARAQEILKTFGFQGKESPGQKAAQLIRSKFL